MDNRRIIDLTVGEFSDVLKSLNSNTPEEVSTKELAKLLGRETGAIGLMGRAGMYEAPGCRIGKNRWNYKKCKEWMETEYKKFLSNNRKRDMLNTKAIKP